MNKYIQYTAIELADDSSFIKWAKGSAKSDNLDWDSWISSNPDKASDVALARSIVLGINFKEEKVSEIIENKVWSKIEKNIRSSSTSTNEKTKKGTRIYRLLSIGAVAAVALILIMINLGSGMDTSIQTSYAMSKTITLPDGSTVQMNADTKVEYDNANWKENRYVSLDGEAFFSVKKGSKFTVETDLGNIKVLGTSFNINTRDKALDVICKTGRVAVSSANKETILAPNQSVTIENKAHSFVEDTTDAIDRTSWINGKYAYNNQPISVVISELERQYDIKITIDKALSVTKYSGGFTKGDLENSLSEVMWPLGLKYSVNGKNVTITKE